MPPMGVPPPQTPPGIGVGRYWGRPQWGADGAGPREAQTGLLTRLRGAAGAPAPVTPQPPNPTTPWGGGQRWGPGLHPPPPHWPYSGGDVGKGWLWCPPPPIGCSGMGRNAIKSFSICVCGAALRRPPTPLQLAPQLPPQLPLTVPRALIVALCNCLPPPVGPIIAPYNCPLPPIIAPSHCPLSLQLPL